jgi:hypothetical protein
VRVAVAELGDDLFRVATPKDAKVAPTVIVDGVRTRGATSAVPPGPIGPHNRLTCGNATVAGMANAPASPDRYPDSRGPLAQWQS